MIIRNEIKLEVRYIDDIKGFGVFSLEFIPKNTIIETCYCMKLFKDVMHPSFDYLFNKDDNNAYLPFGYGSIYNHSYDPNCVWKIISEELGIIQFYSIKDIEIGDEIVHSYGELYWRVREKKLI